MDRRKTTRVVDQRLGVCKEGAMKSVEKQLQTKKICSCLWCTPQRAEQRASGCMLSQFHGFVDQERILSGGKIVGKNRVSRRSFSFDTVGIIHREFVTEGTTDNTPMRGRTTGICSEKCVVRRFLRRANVIQ
jgi:hypothetical protein